MMKKLITLLILAFFVPGGVIADGDIDVPEKIELEGFDGLVAKTGGIYLASQPTEAVLEWAQSQGVTTIINLRSDAEMEKHTAASYDEAAMVDKMGLEYVHIPLGGKKHPYTEISVEAFAEAMTRSGNQNVLVHCASAGRVSYMWAAWLVKYQGFEVEDAVEHARAVNFGKLPIEKLLGQELLISAKPE